MKLGILQLHITADIADNKTRIAQGITEAPNSSYCRNSTIPSTSAKWRTWRTSISQSLSLGHRPTSTASCRKT